MNKMWGIHNDTLTTELVDEGFVSIGWDQLGDLRAVGTDRDSLRASLAETYPNKKPRAIAGWTGILHRFVEEIAVGDIVVAPYKPDSTVNIGIVTGPYEFAVGEPTHRHRRPVAWKKIGVSRTVFSQAALYELGAFLAVFGIRKHDAEFRAALESDSATVEDTEKAVEAASQTDADTTDEPRASRIDRHTRDFVLERLKSGLTHQEFEEFTADLLRALGYEARVTAYTQDGGVDVIAHRDPLGIEPPLIKVQCKHHTGTVGAPEVQQLIGTQSPNELSLFVTLGAYSRDALGIERVRQGLRLISGEDVVDLVLRHYDDLSPRWRGRIPLRPVLVVDDEADA
jgi:restriction system protein